MNRAKRPYPPVDLKINGGYFPASTSNPMTLTWKRRNRLNTAISLPSNADETPEPGTEYFALHGPIGAQIETSLGTGTTGTLTLAYAGLNTFYVYAKRDGLESTKIRVDLSVTSGASGVSAGGPMADLAVTASPSAAISVQGGGALADMAVSPMAGGGSVG